MDLRELRTRLTELDRQIIELIAERQAVVEDVGAIKRADGQATRDFAREKQVIDAARKQAAGQGIDPQVAETLMLLLIRSSLTRQERARVRAEGKGHGKGAMVIGGAGKMGRWFADFLDSQGFDVTVADPAADPGVYRHVADWRAAGDEFALTVIAAPLRETAEILEDMAGMGRNGLVFDVGSLKSPLIPGLRSLARAGVRATSIHPMFGPDTELLSDKHVLFLDAGSAEASAEARALFASTMAQQTEMALEDHDRLIAYVLGLSHALNIGFFGVLADSGEDVPRLSNISSTTFDAQLAVASRVVQENPHLYFEIQSLNEHGLEPLEALQTVIGEIVASVRESDEEAFVGLMERGRAYLERRR